MPEYGERHLHCKNSGLTLFNSDKGYNSMALSGFVQKVLCRFQDSYGPVTHKRFVRNGLVK